MSTIKLLEELTPMTSSEIVKKYYDEIEKQFVKYNLCYIIHKEILEYRNFKFNFYITIQVKMKDDKIVPCETYVKSTVDCIDLELEEKLSSFYDSYDFMHHYMDGCSVEIYEYLINLAKKDIDRFFDKTVNDYNDKIEKLEKDKKYIESKIEELS